MFCCWQAPALNDWLRLPLQAALRHVPAPAATDLRVALAALAMVLGWFLVMAMIVAVAAIVILIMSMVM